MRPPAAARAPAAPATPSATPRHGRPLPARRPGGAGRSASTSGRRHTQPCILAASTPRDDDGPSPSGSVPPSSPARPSSPLPQESRTSPATPLMVRVRLSVHYRVHSRQMLCIGGSSIPFGWSFVSISKVPMAWSPGDVWAAELELPAGSAVEYKYVVLEEQDWTRQVSEDAEGLVTFTYRGEDDGWQAGGEGGSASASSPPPPPGVLGPAAIQRQMAIVAWAPGPNKVVRVPTAGEVSSVPPGGCVDREPARPSATAAPGAGGVGAPPPPRAGALGAGGGGSSAYAFGRRADGGAEGPLLPGGTKRKAEDGGVGGAGAGADATATPPDGTWEKLSVGADGVARLERRDVWGGPPPPSPAAGGIVATPTTPPPGYGLR